MILGPLVIKDSNLSYAWAKAFAAVVRPSITEISSLTVSITDFEDGEPQEDAAIRWFLDEALAAAKKKKIDTVANTIFPVRWNSNIPAQTLYNRYLAKYARLQRIDPANKYGTYFGRMIAYSPQGGQAPINQLQHIIATFRSGNHRRSALQIGIFDPCRDHTDQRRRGFPCLQQVALAPTADGGLLLTGFFPVQTIFPRAYGNYLGLARLGKFLAHEMGLTLTRVTCFANVAQLGVSKETCRDLGDILRSLVSTRRVA